MGILLRIAAGTFPQGDTAVHPLGDRIHHAFLLGENHGLHLDVLDVNAVDAEAGNYREYDGIQYGLDIIDEQADCVDAEADDDSHRAHLEVRSRLGHADADQVLSALRASGTKHHSGAHTGAQTAHDGSQHRIADNRLGRNRNDGQQCRSHRDGYQRFQTELLAHYLVSQQEERNVDGEVDDAHVIQPRNFRKVQHV